MRPFLSISLVILLLLNLFGFYIAYCVKLDGVRDGMEETLRTSQTSLQVITLNYKEYRSVEWTTPGKECRINGTMYDVAKTEVSPGEVKLYVKADEGETTLNNNFTQNFQAKQELPNSPVKLLVNMIGQDFILAKNKIAFSSILSPTIFKQHVANSPLAEFIMEKISPPPWC